MSFSIPEFLTEERSLLVFAFANILLGGGAAFLAGRAIASTWQPWWRVALYMALLGVAVRFIHFALFGSRFWSPHYYLVDATVCLLFGLLGFRLMRVRQMVGQYRWINRRSGFFAWRRNAPDGADAPESR